VFVNLSLLTLCVSAVYPSQSA